MTNSRVGVLLIAIAYVGFISLGLPDGLLGVAWPSIRAYFGISLDALGALLLMSTSGYLLSSSSSGRILARLNVGSLLAISGVATATALIGYGLTPFWSVLVGLGFLAGMGAGAIDAGLNTYVALYYSARTLNWLHACYGIGATIGPIIMTSVLTAGLAWQWGYLLVGGTQMALAICFGLTRGLWQTPGAARDQSAAPSTPAAPPKSTLRLTAAWLSIGLFFLYTGLEVSAGQWAYSLFTEARAIPPSTAGLWISIYWGALTVGRVIFGIIVGFVAVKLLLRLCIIGTTLGAALLWLNVSATLSFLGLALMGLALAPIFPSLISTTPRRLGVAHAANGVGFQVGAAALGAAILPGVVGIFARQFGLEVVGPLLVGAGVLMFILYAILE